jgi:hypothetical protein
VTPERWRVRRRWNPLRHWIICGLLGHYYEWRRIPGDRLFPVCSVCERLEVYGE